RAHRRPPRRGCGSDAGSAEPADAESNGGPNARDRSVGHDDQLGEPRQRQQRHGDSAADLPRSGRQLLPGVPAVGRHRKPASTTHQHRVPTAGRLLADAGLRGPRAMRWIPSGLALLTAFGPAIGLSQTTTPPKDVFDVTDTNHDGKISPEEYRARMVEV